MKRKLLAFIATLIIVSGTTLVPAGSFLLAPRSSESSVVGLFGVQTAYAQSTTITTTTAVTTPPDNTSGVFECGYTDILCGLVKLANILLNSITNLLATVAGLILDFSIHYSISSSTYSNDAVNTILVMGWKLIRDFSTIFLMFALFVVGFMLIFNAEGSDGSWAAHFSPGRTIARVIIVALLVNFSFLICRGVIDVGNIFAIVLYDKVDQGNPSVQEYPSAGSIDTSTMFGKPSEVFKNLGISNIKSISVGLLANINPQRVILDPNLVASNKTGNKLGNGYNYSFYVAYLFVSFISAILNLLLLFIFASMAFLFLGRIIGLYIGIILSPFAFVSWTIPFLENMPYIGFDNWFKEFLGLVFLGPVYMLFVYLTVAFMKIPETLVTGSNAMMVAVFATINALLCVFVLLKGKKIAESMAGEIGTKFSSFTGKLATMGVGLATGGTAMLAGGTIGAAGGILARSGTLKRLQDAGPSQKQEDVQQRMKTASTFRKFGLGGLANSVEKGNFSTGGMLSNAARNVRGMGKSLATTNPLDAKILGTSVRGGAASIAKLSGNRDLAASLIKGIRTDARTATIKDRAFDIAATQNARALPTSLPTNTVPNVNPKPTAPVTNPVTKTTVVEKETPIVAPTTKTFSLAGMTLAGQVRPPSIIPPPPNNPPTGGATSAGENKPPQAGGVPIRLAGNTPLDQKTSGVTMPKTMFNQNMKPEAPVTAPDLKKDMDDLQFKIKNENDSVKKESLQQEFFKLEEKKYGLSAPTTKSGSSATSLLANIQTASAQQEPKVYSEQAATKGTFGDGSAKAPEYTPVQQERILNKAIASQQRSTQVAPAVEQKSEAIMQASTIAGTRSAAVQSVNAQQSAFVEKNMGTAPVVEKAPSYVPHVTRIQTDQEKVTYNNDVLEKQIRSFQDTDVLHHSGFNDFMIDHVNSRPGSASSLDNMIATKESVIDAWKNRKVDASGKYIKE